MTPAAYNRVVHREIDKFFREGILTPEIYGKLKSLYVITRWDWHSLGRWFLLFGAISVAAGGFIYLRNIVDFTLEQLAVLLTILMLGFFAGGQKLKHGKNVLTRRSLELLGGITLIGLTFTLGIIYSSGSGNWPALLLIDLLVLLPLTYLLNNVLLLILSSVVFFTWFGGVTGYVSGWGAYWFGMNYPLRFFFVSLAIIGISIIHRNSEDGMFSAHRGFFKVWLSMGLFFGEMSLWLMSLFGNFGTIRGSHRETLFELFIFNVLWAGSNILLIYLGSRYSLRMARGYGATFLFIQGYTVFFRYIAGVLGPILSTFVAGGFTLWLVIHLEKTRRKKHPGGPVENPI